MLLISPCSFFPGVLLRIFILSHLQLEPLLVQSQTLLSKGKFPIADFEFFRCPLAEVVHRRFFLCPLSAVGGAKHISA